MDPSKRVSSMPTPTAPSVPASMPIPPVASMPAPSMPAPPATSMPVPPVASMPAPPIGSMPIPPVASMTTPTVAAVTNSMPSPPASAVAASMPTPAISTPQITSPNNAIKPGKRARPDTTTSPATAKRPKSNPIPKPASSTTPKKESNDVKSDVKPSTTPDDDCMGASEMKQFVIDKVNEFGPSMLKRYESYRRSDLRIGKIKKVCAVVNPALQKVSEPYVIALKGLAKVFVGEVVETALEVRKQLGDKGPLRPKHLREAYRRLRRDGAVPTSSTREM